MKLNGNVKMENVKVVEEVGAQSKPVTCLLGRIRDM